MKKSFFLCVLLSVCCHIYAQDMSTKAVNKYKQDLQSARAGNVDKQAMVGYYYIEGIGTQKDYQKAYYWCNKAAEKGDSQAQCNLGYLYDTGKGVQEDCNKAVYWYKKSAENGFAQGQFNLAYMYESGRGVEKDNNKAIYWFKKAAEQGHSDAKKKIAELNGKEQGSQQSKQNSADGNVIARGLYTITGVYKQGGQFYSSGNPYLTSFDIYENCLYEGDAKKAFKYVGTETCDNIRCRRYGSNNDNYYLVTPDGSVRRSWSFSANYPFLGTVRTTSINYYDKGDTRAAYMQGNSSNSGGNNNNSTTTPSTYSRQPRTCGLCGGKGWVDTDEGVSDFGSNNKKWCDGCQKWVYMNHYHKSCPSCKGKGKW